MKLIAAAPFNPQRVATLIRKLFISQMSSYLGASAIEQHPDRALGPLGGLGDPGRAGAQPVADEDVALRVGESSVVGQLLERAHQVPGHAPAAAGRRCGDPGGYASAVDDGPATSLD